MNSSNKYKKLFQNTGIFLIANMGSKIISFFMVRFYTEMLSPTEYGTLDILTTIIFLIAPLCSLSIQEAVFRYCMEKDKEREEILKSAYGILKWGSIVIILCGLGVYFLTKDFTIIMLVLIVISEIYYNVSLQYSRGVGRIQLYALCGVLYTTVMVIANIVYMAVFRWGLYGYLLAIMTANTLVTLFIVVRLKFWIVLRQNVANKELTVNMVKYSLPMVPNAIFWWLMSVADKYVLIYVHGIAMNGIYAVANKIPTVLNVFGGIFFQAWQMSAIEVYRDEDKENFYSNVFSVFYGIMVLIVGALNVVIKPIYTIFVAKEYFIAWKYTSFLMLAMLFSAASCFVGTYYSVVMKTNKNLKTTMIGLLVNLVMDFLLIPHWGIQGAAIATFVGYFATWIVRMFDIKQFIHIEYNYLRIALSLLCCVCQAILLALEYSYAELINAVLLLVLLYNEKNTVKIIMQRVIGIIKWERK